MRQSIRGYADGVIEEADSAALARMAAELGAVGDLLDGSQDLRRVLLDPGVAVGTRLSVVRDLLADRVSVTTFSMIVHAIEVDRASELADDVSWLASRMDAAAQGLRPASDAVLGRLAAQERIDGLAAKLLEGLGSESELASVEDDLFRFHQTVEGSEELRAALTSSDLPAEVRVDVVKDLMAGRPSPVAEALCEYAINVGRPRDFPELLLHIVDRVAFERNRRLAEVRSAVELDDSQRMELAAALGRVIGREVDVRVTVDPHVLAGFVATVGDIVVDGSARHRLELLKERLVLPEVTHITGEPTDG